MFSLIDWLKKQANKSAKNSGKNKNKRNNVAHTTRSNSKGNQGARRANTVVRNAVSTGSNTGRRGGIVISNKTAAKIKNEQQKKKQQTQSLTGTEKYKELQKKRAEAAKRGGNRTREERKQAIETTKDRLKHVYEANAKSISDQTKKALEKNKGIDALGVKNGTTTYRIPGSRQLTSPITDKVVGNIKREKNWKPGMSDEFKKKEEVTKDDYKKESSRVSRSKQTEKGRTVTVKNLNSEDYNKMATSAMTGQFRNLMKSDKKLSKKVADKNVADYANGTGVMGAIDQMTMGLSVSDDPVYKYTDEQKKFIESQKNKTSYNVGRMIGAIGEFALGGTNALGSGLVKAGAKTGTKNLLKTVAKETAADALVSTPLNLLDATKASYKDGKIDKNKFAKEAALNIGGDVILGGLISGAGAGAKIFKTKSDYYKYIKIKAKKEAGAKLTKAEQDFYDKGRRELTNQYIEKEVQKEKEKILNQNKTAPKAVEAEKPITSVAKESNVEKMSNNGVPMHNAEGKPKAKKYPKMAKDTELESLKKEQKTLSYKLENTKNPEHYKQYRTQLEDINSRIDKIYEKYNYTPKEDINFKEPRSLDELKADEKSAKISTESKNTKQESSFKETTDKAWQSTKRLVVDNFAAFENIGRTLRKIDKAKGDSFMASINALRLTKNKAGAMLKEGRINRYGKTDKSLVDIFDSKEYGNLLKDKEKYEDFQYYLFNRHNIDRAREGKNVFGNISSSESEVIAKELERKYGKEFIDRANEIYSYLADLEDMRIKSGLSSAEQFAELDNIYKSYVPTYRVGDKATVSWESGLKNYKQYEATGGNSEIMPIHEQLVMLTNKTIKESEKNMLMRAVADSQGFTVEELSALGVKNPEKMIDKLLYKSDNGTKYEVKYFVDGKAHNVTITDEMYKGMLDWTKQDSAAIIKMVDKATSPLNRAFKAVVTDYNPIFMVRNFVRDTQEAFLYSKDTRYWVKNWPKAISALTSKNSEYRQAYELYKANGGKYSNLVDLETDVAKLDTGWKKKNPLERLEALNNAIETIPRLAEFMGTLDKAGIKLNSTTSVSKDVLNKAMYNANDITLNFGRSGKVTKYLNRTIIPYLNPSIQGLDKLVRTLQGDRGVKGYLGLIAKGSIFLVAPSVANSILCKDVDGYREINDRDKENNYLIPVGDERFIKIPKSRVGGLAGMPIRMAYESWEYGNAFDWKYLFKQAWELQGITDVSGGGLFQPIIGAATNKTWYGGQIESGSEDDTYESEVWKTKHGRSNEVYDSNTSAIGKYLGNTAIMKKLGISPKKIDYVLDGTTGIIGDILLPATSQNSAGRPSAVISKSFVLDAVFSNKLSTDFYEKASKLRGNQVISEAEKNKYYEFQCRYGYSASTILQSIADIQSSDMSKAEKAEKSRELRKALNEIYKNERDGIKSVSDALTPIGKVIGFDKALSGYLYDNKSSGINHANAYKIYRENLSLDKMKPADREKAAKRFLNSYNKAINIQSKIAPNYSNNPDYKTLAVTGALMGNKAFSDAYGVSDDNQKLAKYYINSYDNKQQAINMHISTQKTLKKGNDEISKLFPKYNSSTTSTKAMIIASSNQLDSQYYFNECDRKMNGARGLTKDYGYTPKSFEKIRSEANTDGKSGISKDEAIAAVEKANCKDNNERALLFNMLCSSWNARNPYGTPKDYSLDNDNWEGKKKDSSGSYGGYRRYGRGYGRRGGSGGSGASEESWEEYVKQFITTPDISTVKTSYKSPLDEAYRAKVNKIIKNMRS